MLYCDYEAYANAGGTMTAEEYAIWGPRASAKIDRYTFGRAENASADAASQLADACAQIADILKSSAEMHLRSAGLSSANNDGVSESYANASASFSTAEKRCYSALSDALRNDPYNLLYLGVE